MLLFKMFIWRNSNIFISVALEAVAVNTGHFGLTKSDLNSANFRNHFLNGRSFSKLLDPLKRSLLNTIKNLP